MIGEIIGHQEVVATLERAIASGVLPHALLFVGSAHVGKTTLAVWLAQRLLCRESAAAARTPSLPCSICPACRQVECGTHPDLFHITGNPTITIDTMRDWTAALSRSSLFAGWKVGIVEGAESMTEEAANACLKAIEEPTEQTLLILTATSRAVLLPTIVSRCALMRCRRVPEALLADDLQRRGITAAEARLLAAAADGAPGLAIRWHQDPALRSAAEERNRLAVETLKGAYADRLRRIELFIKHLPEDRAAAQAEVRDFIRIFRGIARDLAARLVGIAETGISGGLHISLHDLLRWMDVLTRAPRYLDANVAPRLVLEAIVLTFP